MQRSEQFGLVLYEAGGYQVEEVEKHALYKAQPTHVRRAAKSGAGLFSYMADNGSEFECECGLFEHMGMLCYHILKVVLPRMLEKYCRSTCSTTSEISLALHC